MTIHEPATLLTDFLLAALSGGLAWRLCCRTPATHLAGRWWSGALGLTALSAAVGGSYHGFAPNFPAPVAAAWWIATLLIICLLGAAMAMSLVHELAPAGRQRVWTRLIVIQLIAFGGVAIKYPVFIVAIIDYGLTLAAWAGAAIGLRRPWRGWMLAGVGLSVIAALVQQLHWAPSRSFNHNDLYHVIQALAIVCFYAAGKKFAGPPPAVTRDGP